MTLKPAFCSCSNTGAAAIPLSTVMTNESLGSGGYAALLSVAGVPFINSSAIAGFNPYPSAFLFGIRMEVLFPGNFDLMAAPKI